MTKDDKIIDVMRIRGGSFVHQLAYCWIYADESNRKKIRETWADLFEEYATLFPEEVA